MTGLLRVRDLSVSFPVAGRYPFAPSRGALRAVDGVSFDIAAGETLGLVGESGCGRMSVGRALAEPVRLHRLRPPGEVAGRVRELLAMVGLPPASAARYPHEFSGGQRQRIGIARALACEPDLLVCDEPVAALDVSVQAQVVNLLAGLQAQLGLTCLFIAHGLSLMPHLAARVAVMYLGRLAEIGDTATIYRDPRHPYTRALLSAVPVPDPGVERRRRRIVLAGEVPSPLDPPPGCRFSTRCPIVAPRCRTEAPPMVPRPGGGSAAACWRTEEIDRLMPRATPDEAPR